MKSLCVKSMLALVVVGLSLALPAGLASAAAVMLDWEVRGSGITTGTCGVSALVAGCTATASGSALGTHVGNSSWTLSLTAGPFLLAPNSSGGNCFIANGTGGVTAANGDVISYNTVGTLCEEAAAGSPYHYNGTFRVTGGTGRFSSAVGAGNVVTTNPGGGGGVAPAIVSSGSTFIHIDGTINY
jgi:hypothetical protein